MSSHSSSKKRNSGIPTNPLERIVENNLEKFGYTFITAQEFEAAIHLNQPIYSRQYLIGENIYDTELFCDFILYHPQKYPDYLVIETRWQEIGGTEDEEYVFLVLNVKEKFPCNALVLVAPGWYKKGAEDWIRNQAGGKLQAVFNMAEFQTWVNNGNL